MAWDVYHSRDANTSIGKVGDARRATLQEAEAARDAAIEDAQTVYMRTYLTIYTEGGGIQSDVSDVMVKLLTHQRERCTKLYGL